MTHHAAAPRHGDPFVRRHIGPRPRDIADMLATLGYDSLTELIETAVPSEIRLERPLDLPLALTEYEALRTLRTIAAKNHVFRSYIGMGYADCIVPPVTQRNILENPGWYTAYTPYQAEISQGRLEALLGFQTMVSDLTALPVANASLLDEATAAAEAMTFTMAVAKAKDADHPVYLVDTGCHPQTIAVVQTRAEARGISVVVADPQDFEFTGHVAGALVQYPSTEGRIDDFHGLCERAHAAGAIVTAAADLLSLALLVPPGEWGADVAVGNTQRFGVPMGYGGPHAAYFATKEEFKRHVPGRLIGVTRDPEGRPTLRMALQTREQHIRREKATSNVCTAQVLLAVMAGMYAVYHGPEGIRRIAERVHMLTVTLADALRRLGYRVAHEAFFDTLAVEADAGRVTRVNERARASRVNFRSIAPTRIGVTLDETTSESDLADLISIFALGTTHDLDVPALVGGAASAIPATLRRASPYLVHECFNRYHSETEMLRYLKRLEDRDLSLTSAMIPLGSCTMKLNAAAEMLPVSWPEFGGLHPFAPREQAAGYTQLFDELSSYLSEITGFPGVSLQPNAGSQGEFTGLLVIRAYLRAEGEGHRTVCLIPQSAHGTNPASAVMAGLKVVVVKTDEDGNVEMDDLRAKAGQYRNDLAALMITYPSTHGVFEATIREMCDVIHTNGGQVYLDGANLNAMVGIARPGDIGADVCHLNLHKTFAIPHGGGGPGMGPIGVAEHLVPFLPDHPVVPLGIEQSCGTVSAAPWGSPSVLPISWAYIRMMGRNGLTEATQVAILNANYIARRLHGHFDLLYAGQNGLIAHECILDTRPVKHSAGVDVSDIATRLMDYGFHAPTVSFPVAGTLMVEPTESESKEELDRFCRAMIAIRDEIREIEEGRADPERNLLKNAPHTLADLLVDDWDRPYSRERAAFPTPETREHKVWPPAGRADAAYGDRNLVCTCPPLEAYEPAGAA
ncbi:MAG: aminomethyl-transferring glycine dehydrogenase [Gemmatimonadota bacterium]|nr:aminomethyl-transferring glycine dehydrogenase [Gemmatimonadota bacterium]MDH3366566.1 aminomethyl-transferring glycine dehydrogenase [Gemmatimonadota bacterium]MDH3479133.1 aminomethyl-transferring glycine dehydrogenase [Gemmatimonadota bacterium]MDH5548864.1 aminomethyl-transferring glycine dehydrogenase [Gemmatimonadota bacterium]